MRQKKLPINFAVLSIVIAMQQAHANSINVDQIWYRDYLDFAQNKGQFKPGTTNLEIVKKDGTVFKLPDLPMPDFSAVSKKGNTTSIGGAYVVTAKHNTLGHHAIKEQSWGNTTYKYVDRTTNATDFTAQRLNKFVVETEGITDGVSIEHTDEGWKKLHDRYGVDFNGERKVVAFRVGAGEAAIRHDGQQSKLGVVYEPTTLSASMFIIEKWGAGWSHTTPFDNRVTGGDSGSSWLVYDNIEKKWVILGTLLGSDATTRGIYNDWDQKLVDEIKNQYTNKVALNGSNGTFTADHSFTHENQSIAYKDKDLSLTGGGTLTLTENLDMGVGGLIFDQNKQYTVNGDNFTFKGAGVDIAQGTTVDWNIKGNSTDNLHKIGKGTLKVNVAQGNNLKTGNGTVELNTQNAFNAIYITAGNATVKLNHADALAKDTFGGIYFANRGGTLDLNGYNFEVQKIAANDIGANITNTNNQKKSTVKIQTSDKYIYHGTLSGNLDLDIKRTQPSQNAIILDGGTSIKGNIDVENNKLVMQGHAVVHAIVQDTLNSNLPPALRPNPSYQVNKVERPDAEKYGKEYIVSNTVSSFDQPDWETREYAFETLNLKNADLLVGRNSIVKGNIVADSSTIAFGGDQQIYRDNVDGQNITGQGFGFQQNVIAGNSRDDQSIVYYGDINAKNSTKIDSYIPYMEASITLANNSQLVAFGDNITKLRNKGISVSENSTLKLQDLIATDLKETVYIKSDQTSALTFRNLVAQNSSVVVNNATVEGALVAYNNAQISTDKWTFKDDNLQTDKNSQIEIEHLSMQGMNHINANLIVTKQLDLQSISHEDTFSGMHSQSLTLGKDSAINVTFTDESLSTNNFAYNTDYTLISADSLSDHRTNQDINFTLDGNIGSITNKTENNKILFVFHEKPVEPPRPDPQPQPQPQPPSSSEIFATYQSQAKQPNGVAIVESILQHNASSDKKYQEVVLDSALHNSTIQGGVDTLNLIVNRTNKVFDDLAQRVDRQSMISPIQTGLTNRLASLRIAQYRGIENYAVASTSGDMSMIGRAMSMDNLHQSFYIDFSAGYKKHHEQKSHVTSTGFGYDRIIRNHDGKYLVGALASFGKLSADQSAQNDDGDLYSLTGYVSYERLNTEGWEFLSYLTLGHLNNERSIAPEINLGVQEFDEKQWMLMSSNALKYNVPLPSGKFQYAFKPMLLADIGVTHNQGTSSAYFKREALTDWSVDLGLGLEYAAFSTDASYSLQLTAKRNVYHSEDTVGVNLSHANGFIQYELAKDKAMQFNLNALTSQELNQSLSIDLMAGLGANTEGEKSIQGAIRAHWKF